MISIIHTLSPNPFGYLSRRRHDEHDAPAEASDTEAMQRKAGMGWLCKHVETNEKKLGKLLKNMCI